MIVSTSLPHRTTLALKNRYSALRTKAHSISAIPPPKPIPDSRSGRSNARRHPGHPTSSGLRFMGVNEIDNDDQTDEEDEDDDEDNEDEGDDAGDGDYNEETFLSSDWQPSMSTNAVTAQGRKNNNILAQPSFHSPPASETQRAFNRPSAIVHWGENTRNSSMSPATYHPNPMQTSYQHNDFHTFGPSSMSVNFGIGSNFTASPDLYPLPRTQQSTIPHNTLSADYSTPKESQDTLMGGVSQVPHKEVVGQSTHEEMAAPTYHGSIGDSVTQHELTATKHRSPTSNQALSTPNTSQGSSQASTMASPPVPTPQPPSPGSRDPTLHRVSVDAECTSEQLGDLVRTLVGVTKKIVVKVDD